MVAYGFARSQQVYKRNSIVNIIILSRFYIGKHNVGLENRLNRIDGLRGIAIFGVIAVHSQMAFHTTFHLVNVGQYGVQLFFLISGYILSFVAENDKNLTAPVFLAKRFFRLAPMYYFVLMVCFLIGFNEQLESGVNRVELNLTTFLWHLSFLHGLHPDYLRSVYSVMWSLTPEVVFYLIFPFLNKLNDKNLWAGLLVALVLAKPFVALSLWTHFNEGVAIWIGHSPLAAMPCFLFGMLVYRDRELFNSDKWRYLGLIAICLFLMDGSGLLSEKFTRVFSILFGNPFVMYVLLMFPALVYWKGTCTSTIMENEKLDMLGKVSYSAFFIHYAVIYVTKDFQIDLPYYIGLPMVLLITFYLSNFTYLYFEQRCIRFGNKFILRVMNRCAT